MLHVIVAGVACGLWSMVQVHHVVVVIFAVHAVILLA